MAKLPRMIRWNLAVMAIFLVSLTIFRLIFFSAFRPAGAVFSGSAFLMGFRYDLRLVCVLGLALLLLSLVPALNVFRSRSGRRFHIVLLSILAALTAFLYVVDYFHYDYLHQRLNASVLNYLKDAGISMNMVWQTYPVLKIVICLLILGSIIIVGFRRLTRRVGRWQPVAKYRFRWVTMLIFVLLLMAGTWGTLEQYPLRWSNVYSLSDPFKAQLALNPYQSFISSLSFKNAGYDEQAARKFRPLIASYLQLPGTDTSLTIARPIPAASQQLPAGTNVVLVICESFSGYKSSMWGNPLNTTPFFNSLCQQGVFFDHCLTPSYGTARGVWATITGIPDVETPTTASRNPGIVDQHTLVSDLKGYEKFYFLGGDANWANIRGVLKANILDLQIMEQADFDKGRVDVWGISDKDLFLEANKKLSAVQKPFFAIIQTADNHRPYTIPEADRKEFKVVNLPNDTLLKYGFDTKTPNDEFNAFRYTDFCFEKFMKDAASKPWYKNTVFVFVGDHGIRGSAGNMFPQAWTRQAVTTVHVPLLFYAPGMLAPRRLNEFCSQADVLPSIMSLLGGSYTNTGLGQSLFAPSATRGAFVYDPDEKKIGWAQDSLYYRRLIGGNAVEFANMYTGDAIEDQALKARYDSMSQAFYQTSRYTLYHNRK